MRVAILSSEALPFAKTGGLADVAGSLTKALHAAAAEVTRGRASPAGPRGVAMRSFVG